MRKLTRKEARFIQEYLIDLNASKAARRAGYSEKSSANIGNENCRKPLIQAEIFKELDKRAKRTNITQDRVIIELKRIALSNMADFARWDGNTVNLKESDSLSRAKTAAVQEISEVVTEAGGRTKIKHHDKIRALELLGRHLGMFKERPDDAGVNVSVSVTTEQVPAMTKAQAEELLKKKQEKPNDT